MNCNSIVSCIGKVWRSLNGTPQLVRKVVCMFIGCLLFSTAQGNDAKAALGTSEQRPQKHKKASIAGMFFDDQFIGHGFSYAYPPEAMVSPVKNVVKTGKTALQFDLVPSEFSGGSVCLNDKLLHLQHYVNNGALQFWIKGSTGEEKAWVALVDEAKNDNKKTVVRVDIGWFGKIGTDWSFISIPLKHFGDKGVYWDEAQQREIEEPFGWNNVAEFRVEVRKGENRSFRVWVDDVIVTKSIR